MAKKERPLHVGPGKKHAMIVICTSPKVKKKKVFIFAQHSDRICDSQWSVALVSKTIWDGSEY